MQGTYEVKIQTDEVRSEGDKENQPVEMKRYRYTYVRRRYEVNIQCYEVKIGRDQEDQPVEMDRYRYTYVRRRKRTVSTSQNLN